MKSENVIISVLPAILFLMGTIFIRVSSLTLYNTINVQYETFDIFMKELMKSNMSTAFVNAFYYLWNNALLTIIFFLLFVTVGIMCYVYFYNIIDFKVLIISQILFLIISIAITNFSLTVISISLSLVLGILWMHKTFEPGKNDFTTCYSAVSHRLNLLSIFLAIGIFLTIFMNLQTYEEQMTQANLKFVYTFIPNATEIKKAQIEQVEDMTEGFKSSLTVEYEGLSSDVRTQCKPMYDAMIVGIENYKREATAGISEQKLPSVNDVLQQFPIFDLMVKITPLLLAFSAYAVISILNPLFGIFSGIIYSIMKKIGTK